MYKIHVNNNVIRFNKKYNKNTPPITIRKGSKVIDYVHSVEILGPSKVVYSPDKPLSCGAKVWIETKSDLKYGLDGEQNKES
jgi:hypothetical protein